MTSRSWPPEREGYVESRRGSRVYVVEPPVEAEDLKRQEVLERVMDLAAAQDVPVEDLAYALLARAGAKPQKKTANDYSFWTGRPRYAIEHLDKEQRAQ